MNTGHHLILGKLTDIVTGETLPDTLDERYRQAIARLLIHSKGYGRGDIVSRFPLEVKVDGRCARVPVTFLVRLEGRVAMVVQYGPGSLVTRYRPALAMGRLVAPYQVPVVVVTNGEQAAVLDGPSGKLTAQGLAAIPDRHSLTGMTAAYPWPDVTSRQTAMEARIIMAFEVDDRCSCDDTVCTFTGT